MIVKNNEVVAAVKKLAKQLNSVKLAQLASKIGTVNIIAKLEKEAEEDATEKSYCNEEMAKTEAKKSEHGPSFRAGALVLAKHVCL